MTGLQQFALMEEWETNNRWKIGVPQGSPVAPILFMLFTAPLFRLFQGALSLKSGQFSNVLVDIFYTLSDAQIVGVVPRSHYP